MFTITQSINAYIQSMVQDIKDDVPVSSGALRDSIEAKVELSDDGFEVGINMLDYGLYQDKGVNGLKKNWGSPYSFSGMIPSSSLDKWIVKTGLAPRSSGKFTSRKGLSFVIARSIIINGIKPKNFIEPNLDDQLEGLANLTAEEIWNDFFDNENEK